MLRKIIGIKNGVVHYITGFVKISEDRNKAFNNKKKLLIQEKLGVFNCKLVILFKMI